MIHAVLPSQTRATRGVTDVSQLTLRHLLEEVENFVGRNFFVLVAVHAAEGCVGLEVLNLAQNLPLALDLELAFRNRPQEVPQQVLRVKSKHLCENFSSQNVLFLRLRVKFN